MRAPDSWQRVAVRVENRSWDYQRVRIFADLNLVRTVRLESFETRHVRIRLPGNGAYNVWAEFDALAGGTPTRLPAVLAYDGGEVVITIRVLKETSDITAH